MTSSCLKIVLGNPNATPISLSSLVSYIENN